VMFQHIWPDKFSRNRCWAGPRQAR